MAGNPLSPGFLVLTFAATIPGGPGVGTAANNQATQTLDNLQKDLQAVKAGQWPSLLEYRADGGVLV